MDFVTHFYDNPAYPNNTYTVAHPTFDDHSRIIAISDIHGNLPYFRGLVEKLHLRADDSLVLLGDLVEKGPESLATLRYAMALREKCRVYPPFSLLTQKKDALQNKSVCCASAAL